MNLIWKQMALADRDAIMEYIAKDKPGAALDMDTLLVEKALALVANPKLGRVGRVKGTREFVAHPHYVMVYQVAADTITIVRVLHTAQQWPN